MKSLKLIPGKSGLARDAAGFIHNLNSKNEIDQIKLRKHQVVESKVEMNNLKNDVNNIQNEIKDIRSLLTQILEKL